MPKPEEKKQKEDGNEMPKPEEPKQEEPKKPEEKVEDKKEPGPEIKPPEKEKEVDPKKAAEEEKQKGLNDFKKTLTDFYGTASLDDLLDSGFILDANGNEFTKEKDPNKRIDKLFDAVNSEEGVYLQHVLPKKDSPSEASYKVSRQNGEIKQTPAQKVFVDPKVKRAAINALSGVNSMMKDMKSKNPEFNTMKNACGLTIDKLSKTSNKAEFEKIIDDYAQVAGKYYQDHAPAKLSKGKTKKTEIAYKIGNINNAVKQNKEAEENIDRIQEMQSRIAAKYVAAHAAVAIKKSNDPAEIEAAKQIQSDAAAFDAAVRRTMNNPTFQFCYGAREFESDKDMLQRLDEGMKAKAGKVLKTVEGERKKPSKERLETKALMKQKTPKRVDPNKKYSSMSLQDQAPIADVVANAKAALEKADADTSKSPELAEFKKVLDISDIRFKGKNAFMDGKAQLQRLGDAVDDYYEKIIDQSPSKKGNKRLMEAARIKDICDQVAAGKQVVPKSDEELKKDIIADRAVRHAAKAMIESSDMKVQRAGKRILINRNELERQKAKVKDSDMFKKLTDGKALDNTFDKPTSKIFMAVGKITPKEVEANIQKDKQVQQMVV